MTNKATIKLEIIANKATVQPPIGPILGQYGIPSQKFCQEFNDQTKEFEEDILLRVKIILNNKRIVKQDIYPNISKILMRLINKNGVEITRLYELANILIKGNHLITPINISNLFVLKLYDDKVSITDMPKLEQQHILKMILKTLISILMSMNIKIIS